MTAFYNEIDKDAAAWLRELIAEGHIAPGIVDERSIEDVRPDELAGFTQCHFFAGIAIWSLALRAAGVPDDYPIWTGSCPCQPFSSAGKGDGFDDERHLWPAFYHLISQRRPAAVLGEQVASKDAMPWVDLVHTDLEALGYAFGAIPFPTAGVGGPHIRDRLYWAGFSAVVTLGDTGSKGLQGYGGHGDHGHQPGRIDTLTAGPVATAGITGRMDNAIGDGWGARRYGHHAGHVGQQLDANGAGIRLAHTGRIDHRGEVETARDGQSQTNGPADQSGRRGDTPDRLAHSDSQAQGGRGVFGPGQGDGASAGQPCERLAGLCADGWLADTAGQRERTNEFGSDSGHGIIVVGSEPRRDRGNDGSDVQSGSSTGPVNGFWRAADWLHCRDGKWRPVEPGTQPLAAGMPRSLGDLSPELQRLAEVAGLSKASLKRAKQFRVGSLRGYGNAINMQAAQAFIECFMPLALINTAQPAMNNVAKQESA